MVLTDRERILGSRFIRDLEDRFLESGGVARIPGQAPDSVSTAWAICALNRLDPGNALAGMGKKYLESFQMEDGRVPVSWDTPEAIWPTQVALLAWGTDRAFERTRARATHFVLTCKGKVLKHNPGFVDLDTTIPGWPWVEGTFSWTEPTAFAIAALSVQNRAAHPRVAQGVQLLLDRMLDMGGWNYGNKRVFGTTLRPMTESTGIAVYALKGKVDETRLQQSISYLSFEYPGITTPLSLARTVLGLSAYDRRPGDVVEKIGQCLALQERYGPFETALVAELAVGFAGAW